MTALDPKDLVCRRAYVRVYDGADGRVVMAEGRVVWYDDGPSLGIVDRYGRQHSWSLSLPVEEIDALDIPDPAPARPETAEAELRALFDLAMRTNDPVEYFMGMVSQVDDDIDRIDISTHADPRAVLLNRWLVVRIPRPAAIDRTVETP